jgi:uncharacterized protein with FMN-binding domain
MTTPDLRSSQWVKSNLAALGSAAVLTVYAAGFARTKAAADLLDEQSERAMPLRRPAARAAVGHVEGTAMPRTAGPVSPAPSAGSAAVASASVATPAESAPPVVGKPSATKNTASAAATGGALSTPAPVVTAPSARPAPAVAAGTTSTIAAPSVAATATNTTTPAQPAPAPGAPAQDPAIVPGAPRDLATTAQATAPAAKGTDAPGGGVAYKDGLYSGWGTSRHGDIEAYVEVKGGKITSAFISECLTQYSCSWIAKLPPMVIEAQSAEIDYISGATHSSNAFYYAVANALKKAQAR